MRLTDRELRAMNHPLRRFFQRYVAADLSAFPAESKDAVVIFGILHHIPQWRDVLRESYRVMRPGGRMFLEEPNAKAVRLWDRLFHWDHPLGAMFTFKELEEEFGRVGFTIARRLRLGLWASYCLARPEGQ